MAGRKKDFFTFYLFKSPDGLTASTTRSMPNETAKPHAGPPSVAVKLSATPRIIAAIMVPLMLPIPPKTVTANTLPMNSLPMEGSTGPMLMIRAPAKLVVAIDNPNEIVLMRIGLAPINLTAELSWATLLVIMPRKVLEKYR